MLLVSPNSTAKNIVAKLHQLLIICIQLHFHNKVQYFPTRRQILSFGGVPVRLYNQPAGCPASHLFLVGLYYISIFSRIIDKFNHYSGHILLKGITMVIFVLKRLDCFQNQWQRTPSQVLYCQGQKVEKSFSIFSWHYIYVRNCLFCFNSTDIITILWALLHYLYKYISYFCNPLKYIKGVPKMFL